jgi:predicted PurR-regulated permease PerM
VRFLLLKKYGDIHPLITIFGLILGIRLFGFLGIILGPLVLSYLFLLIKFYKKDEEIVNVNIGESNNN